MSWKAFKLLQMNSKHELTGKGVLGLILLVLLAQTGLAQVFPLDFEYSKRTEYLLDAGYFWEDQQLEHPLPAKGVRWESEHTAYRWMLKSFDRWGSKIDAARDKSRNGIGVVAMPGLGFASQSGDAKTYDDVALQPRMLVNFIFHENIYGGIYSQATNEAASMPHFTGVARDRSRFGFDTGEFDQAYLGIKGDWYQVEYGRNRNIWGPLTENNLVLSANQPSYERLSVTLSFWKMKARYFYGFLEAYEEPGTQNVFQRYISGRMLEYSNGKNFLLGLGEITILSGIDRPLDLAFLNPIALHLETDQNNRSNATSADFNNAVWVSYLDWYAFNQLRISTTLLMDEFQLDDEDREEGRPDNMAYLGRLAWTPQFARSRWMGVTLFSEYLRINTYTLQHFVGTNNFVSRGELLFHPIGNDADRYEVGGRMVFGWPMILEAAYGSYRWGENSIINDPYSDFADSFIDQPFPSGRYHENTYLRLDISAEPLPGLQLGLETHMDLDSNTDGTFNSDLETYTAYLRYQIPLVFGGGQ